MGFHVFFLVSFSRFLRWLGVFDSLGLHVLLRRVSLLLLCRIRGCFYRVMDLLSLVLGSVGVVYLCGVWVGAYDEDGTVHKSQLVIINSSIGWVWSIREMDIFKQYIFLFVIPICESVYDPMSCPRIVLPSQDIIILVIGQS